MAARIEVVPDVAHAAALRIADAVRGGGHIALSGGSTPKAAHQVVAAMDLDWSGTQLWFSDDRAVAPDDENSNFLMARESLLDLLDGPQPTVHRVRGELGSDAAAQDYEDELRKSFGDGPPRMDLLLLGIGPDVHTASLFPHKPALREHDRWVVGVPEPGMEPYVPRVTFTFDAIDAAKEVVFLISGEGKAQAARRAFGGEPPGEDAPASMVAPAPGTLTALLDPAAAALFEDRA